MSDMALVVSLVTIGGTLIGIVAFVLGNAMSSEQKRQRIYGRIDECKAELHNTFQRKDICDIHVANICSKVDKLDKTQDSISEKIDKLLQKNGLL